MIVAKVGGSLFDAPQLGPWLRSWCTAQPSPVLLIPGGGLFAEAVRELDRTHALGEAHAHKLAMRTLSVTRLFIRQLVGDAAEVLETFEFFEQHPITPHTWAVSSDSLALAVAQHLKAEQLVLLKSIDIPVELPWPEAARQGLVDQHFPIQFARVPISISVVNARVAMTQQVQSAVPL